MVEEAVESYIESGGLWLAFLALLAGGGVLIFFVEKLISYLIRTALGLGVSVFSLAIIFTGFEFDDTVLALVFASNGLEEVALGTALGTALAIVGITLAVAALVHPFDVAIPRDYLALFVVSPFLLLPLVLLGTLTFVHGVVLVTVFFVFLAYIVVAEHRRETPVFRDTDVVERVDTDGGDPEESLQPDGGVVTHEQVEPIFEDRFFAGRAYAGYLWAGLAVLALVGVVFGSILIETSSEVLVEETGFEETVFGATVITVLLTFENIVLTLEPVRRGIPEIGIGHVIGSVVFSVTANIGFILLVADLTIGSGVLYFHFPALLLVTLAAAYVVATREIRRWHGLVLGGLYAAYWVGALLLFGGVPISG